MSAMWAGIGQGIGQGLTSMGENWAKMDLTRESTHEMMNYDQAMFERNAALQREFAQNGIRWKTEDAQRAGIHPLYAMGASTTAASPISSNVRAEVPNIDLKQMGQGVSRAIEAMDTSYQTEQRQTQLDLMRSQIKENDARAGFYDSESARRSQDSTVGGRNLGIDESKQFMGDANQSSDLQGKILVQPNQIPSGNKSDSSVTAGSSPGFSEYIVTDSGLPMRLPYSQEGPGETWGELSWYDKAALVAHNSKYYGKDWLPRFVNEFLGIGPGQKWPDYVPSKGRNKRPQSTGAW